VILQVLYQFAQDEKLIEGMEVKDRMIHLVLCLKKDGSVSDAAPWQVMTREVENPKTKAIKSEVGRPIKMPEFPGVNNGGKANFLFDAIEKVLGVYGNNGEPIPDDPSKGGNVTKAFLHFWQRIADAHAATGLSELAALLAFHDRYLTNEDARRTLPFLAKVPPGKDGKPVPLEKSTITFGVGASGGPIFQEGSSLHDYWKGAFNRERFVETPVAESSGSAARRGVCLITGAENEPVAESHRTLIKGVPGLPPIGGYLVSFDKSSPALTSFGFEGGWNAPVSETAAAGYALAINQILGDEHCRRRFGGAVLASWIAGESKLTEDFNEMILDPPASKGDVTEFFKRFEAGGRYSGTLNTRRFRSVTLAANGGRVVVRRWLDTPLIAVKDSLKLWFDHLETEAIVLPAKAPKAGEEKPSNAPPPLSIYALAATTARVASEVADGVYDALYRAALEPGINPRALLAPVLHRLRIAAAQSGDGIRFKTSHFALIKLILIRSQESEMEITHQLCETNDPAYNCGRLLAVLDDLQRAAQGRVGSGIVARFYGNASTYPRNVFSYLMKLSKHHVAKLVKDPSTQAAGFALSLRVNEICLLFTASSDGAAAEFPGLLNPQQQGRFALGFHQQKGKDERDRKAASVAKKQAKELDAKAAEAAAVEEAITKAMNAEKSN
jgi:CRISPR-associated protein Csd1